MSLANGDVRMGRTELTFGTRFAEDGVFAVTCGSCQPTERQIDHFRVIVAILDVHSRPSRGEQAWTLL